LSIRTLLIAVASLLVVGFGLAWVAPRSGEAWPYPERLPTTFNFGGHHYQDDGRCQTVHEAAAFVGGVPRRIGSLTSIVVLGAPDVLASTTSGDPPATLFVRNGECLQRYSRVGDL
jgi:hypothetical protein